MSWSDIPRARESEGGAVRHPPQHLGLVGRSSRMQTLRAEIKLCARSDRSVLVTGPSGSGKELVVQAIHALSRQRSLPLLDINCGALPAALFESQLFGHERGAFTGADRQQDGLLSLVQSGTLFLDEIAELPLNLQVKLLRVLETGAFRPIGAAQPRQFNGRIIAATHANLEERVETGRFRLDLFYRLNILELELPSLTERTEDIPDLVTHFAKAHVAPIRITEEAVQHLQTLQWPGNVRQLRNLVERLTVFCPDTAITTAVLARINAGHCPRREPDAISALAREVLRQDAGDKIKLMERALVEEALRLSSGNKTAASRLLGVHRKVVERCTGQVIKPGRIATTNGDHDLNDSGEGYPNS